MLSLRRQKTSTICPWHSGTSLAHLGQQIFMFCHHRQKEGKHALSEDNRLTPVSLTTRFSIKYPNADFISAIAQFN